MVPDHDVLICGVEPVVTCPEPVLVQLKLLLLIVITRDVCFIDVDTEGAIRALDVRESVIEEELGDVAARPRTLVQFRCCLQRKGEDRRYVPLLRVLEHVPIGLNWITDINSGILTSQLVVTVLLEGAMVLVEVVEAVVDLRVLHVFSQGEADLAVEACAAFFRTQIVIPDLEVVQLVRLLVKQVAECSKDEEEEKHEIAATSEVRSDYQVTHVVVQHSLLVREVLYRKGGEVFG